MTREPSAVDGHRSPKENAHTAPEPDIRRANPRSVLEEPKLTTGGRTHPALSARAAFNSRPDTRRFIRTGIEAPSDQGRADAFSTVLDEYRNRELSYGDMNRTVDALARRWVFLLEGMTTRSQGPLKIFRNTQDVIRHIHNLSVRGRVMSPHVCIFPDPFPAGTRPKAHLGTRYHERGYNLLTTLSIARRPYRFALGREPVRSITTPDTLWQLIRPYIFLDRDACIAMERHDPRLHRQLEVVASLCGHDMTGHGVVDIHDIEDFADPYSVRLWAASLTRLSSEIDGPRSAITNLELLAARLHRACWQHVMATRPAVREAIIRQAQLFYERIGVLHDKLVQEEVAAGHSIEKAKAFAESIAAYLLGVYFDKNLYFVLHPSRCSELQLMANDDPRLRSGRFQTAVSKTDTHNLGPERDALEIGELMAELVSLISADIPLHRR